MKSLKSRISFFLFAVTLITSLIIGGLLYTDSKKSYDKSIDRSLIETSISFKEQIDVIDRIRDNYKKDIEESNNLDDRDSTDYSFRFNKEYSNYLIEIFYRNGEIVASPQGSIVPIPPVILNDLPSGNKYKLLHVDIDSLEYKVLVREISKGHYLFLGRELAERSYFLSRNMNLFFLTILLAFAIAIISGLILGEILTSRLEKLRFTAEDVARTGNVKHRFNTNGDDEIANLGKSFNKMLEEIDISRDEQDKLVDYASHELKTPLTSLKLNVEMLEKYKNVSEEDRSKILSDIRSSVSDLELLFEELLQVGKGSTYIPQVEELNLKSEISNYLASNPYLQGDQLKYKIHGEDPRLSIAKSDLKKIIDNLVDNSRKYSKGDSIDLSVFSNGIIFSDNGTGFSDDDLKYGTTRFYRGANTGDLPGSGLGLSIIKFILRRYNGDIKLSNGFENGAVITIVFN